MDLLPRSQLVLTLARKEADRLNHHFVFPEHLLLGIMALGNGPAFDVLASLGLNLEKVHADVEKQVGVGAGKKETGTTPYSPQVTRVLILAQKAAKERNLNYIGTEHLLLGLLSERNVVVSQVLKNFGSSEEKTMIELENVLKNLKGESIDKKPGVFTRFISKAISKAVQSESSEVMAHLTPRAQKVLVLSRKEADRFNHNFVGTEHVLLG
jgi:ATP-dependent Clp protease ATP-binding subunit ClpC